MSSVPLNVPASCAAVIVTVLVADAFTDQQLQVPITDKVITDDPAPTTVTSPLVSSIVATDGVAELHAPPVTSLLNVVVPFEQIASVPLNVPASGAAVIVTVLVAVAVTDEQLPVPVTV